MALTESFIEEDIHPIDIVENIAAHEAWDFDRIAEDQIAMIVEGRWRTYSITLAWSAYDQTLRMVCTFEMEPPANKYGVLFEALNEINDQCWAGAFTYWTEQSVMVYRYGLLLCGGQVASTDQISKMISSAVAASERYYPAFQLVVYGDQSAKDAMQVAIAEAYGRA